MPKIGNMTPLAEATLASPTVEIRMTRQEQLAELAREPDEKPRRRRHRPSESTREAALHWENHE
jgi:hypothetical protein